MMYAGPGDEGGAGLRAGGLPLLPADVEWPRCAECKGAMQFLAHLAVDGGPALEVFKCLDEDGLCYSFESDTGANTVLVVTGELEAREAPGEGTTRLDRVWAIELVHTDAVYEDPLPSDDIMGQLGGTVWWVQTDQTPNCSDCGRPMDFEAQLEEPPGEDFTFGGGGAAYVFRCRPCVKGALVVQR
jgi:hypothetical protein